MTRFAFDTEAFKKIDLLGIFFFTCAKSCYAPLEMMIVAKETDALQEQKKFVREKKKMPFSLLVLLCQRC